MRERTPGFRGALTAAIVILAAGAAAVAVLPGGPALAAPSTPAVSQAAVEPLRSPAVAAAGSYADLVERVAPAVVTIRTAQVVRTGMPDDFFHRFFRDPGTGPPAQRRGGLGSGVVVSADGYILTNHHVVEGAQSITVELSDRRQVEAELVGSDPPSDLAVLRIDTPGLAALPLGDSDEVRVGDVVLAFGNPLGVGQTVTSGIISAKGRATGISDGGYEDFLQTDAPINRGNSGGPLVSTRGELIGINTQILSQTGGNIGIGFAIPSDMAADVMQQLIENGRVRRGRLGVSVQPMSSDLAQSFGLDEVEGALVNQVDADGPAAAAGLERGDVILAVDGEAVRDHNDLRNRIARRAPGSRARFEVLRSGERRSVEATLGEMGTTALGGDGAEQGAGEGRYGMQVAPLTPELAGPLGTGVESGVVVAEVDPAGPAAAAGIQRGDVILEVDRRPVASPDSLQAALDAAGERPALLLVDRRGTTLFLTLSR
jgi:Do/DeqQ family serine protease